MRELTEVELEQVAGGLDGTPIPFTNGFWPGPRWPSPVASVSAVHVAIGIGYSIGAGINNFNTSINGMSLGESIYRSQSGGKSVSGSSTKLGPQVIFSRN